jgi:hypothetical protein
MQVSDPLFSLLALLDSKTSGILKSPDQDYLDQLCVKTFPKPCRISHPSLPQLCVLLLGESHPSLESSPSGVRSEMHPDVSETLQIPTQCGRPPPLSNLRGNAVSYSSIMNYKLEEPQKGCKSM